jgi:hypothetical protein
MRLITTLLILFAVFCFNGCSKAPETTASKGSFDEPLPVSAKTEEETKKGMIKWAGYLKLDANKLKLDEPFVEFDMDVTPSGKAEAEPETKITQSYSVVYPIVDNEKTHFSLRMFSWEGEWKLSSPVHPIDGGNSIRAALIKQTKLKKSDFFRIHDIRLGYSFVAYRQNGKLFLASLENKGELGLKAGEPLPVEVVARKLHTQLLREAR